MSAIIAHVDATAEALARMAGDDVVHRELSLGEVVERIRLGAAQQGAAGPSRPYATVSTVYTCVKIKSDATSRMRLSVSDRAGNTIESGPLVALAENPNPRQTGRKFWRDTSAHLDLFGRFFWWVLADSIGRPVEVHVINPLQLKPIIHTSTGEILAWKFRAAGTLKGQETIIPAEEIHYYIDPDYEDADSPMAGLSPRSVASRAIRQLWKADTANEASLDNGVEPGGVFMIDGTPDEKQIRDMREQIAERSGAANRRRHLVLYGGMKWQTIGASFSDAEFVELKRMNRVEVCAAFQVPPACAGYYEDSNYSHADSAEESLWMRTIIPRSELFAEEWTAAVLSRFTNDRSLSVANARREAVPANLRRYFPYARAATGASRREMPFFAWFDSSSIPAVITAQLRMMEQAMKLWSMGIPLNQIIATLGLMYAPVPWGDTWYKEIGKVDVREDTTPGKGDPDGPAVDDGTEDDDVAAASDGGGKQKGVMAKADPDMARLHQRWRATWAPLERAARGKIRRHFNDLRVATLKRFDAMAGSEAKLWAFRHGITQRNETIIGTVLFDITEAKQRLVATVGPLMRESYRLGGEQSMREAAEAQGSPAEKADPFNMQDTEAVKAMEKREVRVTGADDTVRRKLAETMTEGIAKGETTSELRDRIKQVFNVADGRATTIARTEVGAAVEQGRQQGRMQSGVPLKTWLWSQKEEGRARHAATESATRANPVPNDQDFQIAGTSYTCAHPRGDGLPPGESVNCSCTTLARYPKDGIKTVFARYHQLGFMTHDDLRALDAHRAGKDARP